MATTIVQRFRCLSCQGIYISPQADGLPYFHVCSDLTIPGRQPNPLLPNYTPPTERERPNKRDETLVFPTRKSQGIIKTQGAGREVIEEPIRGRGGDRDAETTR